jgi:sulfatase modifying factor 1
LQKPEVNDGFLFTCPVGTFGENEAGLTDMGGNVWQWCADNYKAYPGSTAPINEDPNVKTTGYKTEAEKFGDSGVFNMETQAWELLPGAFWLKPFGPSGPEAVDDHPVTHTSWNDAVQYASWAGKRLPTEAEWEYAARSGKNSGNKFSWGNEVSKDGKYFANTWQGELQKPEVNDGFLFTCPVGTFGENEAGLTDMGGNVWQWCADNYKAYPGSTAPIREDPNVKTIRSGSFFFDQYGEDSYSVSGRSLNSHETSLFNTGFRCAISVN